jgi:DNA-binding protein H-NS
MATLNDLLAQKADLERQIADAQRAERGDAIARVKALMAEYGLTLADLGPRAIAAPRRAGGNSGKKVAPKYRDPATGKTWSGRGLKPTWLAAAIAAGKSLTDFSV